MYKILTILLLSLTTLCYGQRYKVCKVYYEDSQNPKANGLEKEEHFDDRGHLIFSKGYGSYINDKNDSYTSYHDTSKYQYIHYSINLYRDTFLLLSISYSHNFTIKGNNQADTGKVFYYYNDKGYLIEEHKVSYCQHNYGGCIAIGDRVWGDTTVNYYKYDDRGNKVLDSIGIRKSNNPTYLEYDIDDDLARKIDSINNTQRNTEYVIPTKRYIYDDNNRLVSEIDNNIRMTIKTNYVYSANGYKLFTSVNGAPPYTKTVTYKYDSENRIIEETEMIESYTSAIIRTYGYFPDKRLTKDVYKDTPRKKPPYSVTHLYTYE